MRPFRHRHYCRLRFEVVRLLLLAGPVCHHGVPSYASFVSATMWRVQFHSRCTKLQHLCNPFWQVAVHTLFGERNRNAWRFAPCLALVATFASTQSGTLPVNRPLGQGPGNKVQLRTVVFSCKISHTCNKLKLARTHTAEMRHQQSRNCLCSILVSQDRIWRQLSECQ